MPTTERSNPKIKRSDGREVIMEYAGPENLRVALQQNLAEPLSLASADFDEDGTPDLISGYSYNGRGIVSWFRGNIDSIYHNTPEAQRRKAGGTITEAPFLSPAQVFEAPVAPDFIGSGDFDADGHWDVAIASRTAKRLYLLSGDGRGGLSLTMKISLDGFVTAMIVGEINRPDGLTDIVIGEQGSAGSQVLVFEGPEGAMRATPERFKLSAAPTAFALGQLEGPSENELVIASGRELIMIYGRDRKLSLNASEQSKVAPPTVERRAMTYLISALAAGDFIWDKAHQTDLALLADDGRAHFLSVDAGAKAVNITQSKTRRDKVDWGERSAVSLRTTSSPGATTNPPTLVTARTSAHQTDDLLLIEVGQPQIQVVNADPAQRDETGQLLETGAPTEPTTTMLNAETSPVAVLPMRLNHAAVSGLVMLRSGQAAPAVLATAPGSIITVNNSDDTNIRDNLLTLREAILLANGGTSAAGGLSKAELTPAETGQIQGTPSANQLDEIRFNIPSIPQSIANTSASSLAIKASDSTPIGAEITQQTTGTTPAMIQSPEAGNEWLSQSSVFNSQLKQGDSASAFSCITPSFGAPNTIRLSDGGIEPRAVAISDFNGDGRADVVTANHGSNDVTVLLGDGAGGFGTPNSFSLGDEGSFPFAIAVDDFNGDGKPDVVTANSGSGNITLLSGNGTGGLATPKTFSLGVNSGSVHSIAVSDFNRDGKPDVVTTNGSNITVMLGNGAGGFTAPNAFAVGSPNSVAVGDFNRDGKADIVTANSSPDTITLLLGNGAGGFSGPNTFGLNGGQSPVSIAVSDFNADGKLDVATANIISNNISVLLGTGDGGFTAPNTISFPAGVAYPSSIAISDFNRDGKPDIWTVHGIATISILLGNGSGGFGVPITFSLSAGLRTGSFPFLAIGDFNADGVPDAATVSFFSANNMTLLLGNGAGGFATPRSFELGLEIGVSEPRSIAIGDFNSDGKPDVVTANQSSANITLLLGNGAGGFGKPNTFGLGDRAGFPDSVAVADFNGDGRADVITANVGFPNVTVLLGNGAGGFAPPGTFDMGAAGVGQIVVADFNADGKPDVVMNSGTNLTVLLGNGVGGFGTPHTFNLGGNTRPIAIGDFNRDGKLDVVTANYSPASISVLLGNGVGDFGSPATFSLGSSGKSPASVAVGDFNGDGNPDVATANNNVVDITVLFGDGIGGFGTPNSFSLGDGVTPASTIAVADFNGDGKPDLVTVNDFPGATITVLLGNGAGGFAAPNVFGLGAGIDAPMYLAVSDLNQDGKPDIVTVNTLSNNVTALLNTCGAAGAADLTLNKSHTGNFTVGALGTFRLAVTDVGPGSTIGGTTITDNLPAGLSFVAVGSADLPGWRCNVTGQTVACSNSILLLPNTSTSVNLLTFINQFVVPNVINSASVATQGENNSGNNTASDTARIGVPCGSQPIGIGDTINGALTTADCFSPYNPNSPFADHYTFSGMAGQPISIALSSAAFDTFLYLVGPDGKVIGSDDDGGGGTNSRILAGSGFFILPTSGTYTIEATSARTNETGNYALSLTTGTPTCTYSIAPTSQAFSGAGGSGTVNVTTSNNCPWTAVTNSTFITINSGASGTGNGAVSFTVSANTTSSSRTGIVTIAGQTFTVTQAAGAACVYDINPTSQSFPALGGSGTVSVLAPNGCAWTATSNASFIIVNGGSGSGNGIASFTVTANTSFTTRTGALTIAGRTFTVVQAGAAANTFTINLVTPLPKISDPVIIDGATQPGFSSRPLIAINGSGLSSSGGGNGLVITAGSSTVRSLTITGFASRNRDAAVVLITNGGNVVEGCYFGTDVSGARSSGQVGGPVPLAAGISLRSSSGNRIGGTTVTARNIISGVDGAGVVITGASTNNLIQGNYIGTDVTGSLSLDFQRVGVYIQGANGNTIGGQTATLGTPPGNVISGNIDYGVFLQDDSLNNLVVGNIIGANGSGTNAVPNGNAGVFIYNPQGSPTLALNNTIGGTTPTARNLISGNAPYGIVLGQGATGTQIQGNYIGTKANGTAALPNAYGVTATQATGSTIGGAIDAARNVISGNSLTGVSIGFLNNGQVGGTGTTIQRNYIGTNAAGTGALGNQADGVFVEVQSITHTIQENVIAFNGSNGVRIPDVTSNPGTPGVRIQIADNSVFSNFGLGIDLGGTGITANDPLDADAGANLLQNFPVLTSFVPVAAKQSDASTSKLVIRNPAATGKPIAPEVNATVSGTLNSTPNTSFTVHWYFSADSACAANQASSKPLVTGRIPNVITNGSGNAGFNIPLEFPVGVNNGIINCTATDPQGNTSEYSACLLVNSATPQWQPVVLTGQQIAEMKAWTVGGRTSVYVKPQFPDAGYRVTDWGQAGRSGNDFTVNVGVEKFSGASIQSVVSTAQIYDLGPLANGTYNFNFKTSGTLAKTLQFTVSSTVPPANPIDDARQFVKQQYRDFLNREADQAGEDFWTDNITKCSDPARRPMGQTVEQCTLRQREVTSGAFFQSPEFQYTGYYVYRMYQGALGRQPKLSEFTPDAQFVGAGIIVNGQLSGAKINQNKAVFAGQFVNCTDATKYRCAEFKAIYDGLSNQAYVEKLFQTTGVNASAGDRAALVNGLNSSPATETRASVLQKVVDGINVISEGNQQFTTSYGQAFYSAELNRAFVQLEYFGYMKRDPDEAGYAFWLGKLNQFGGDFLSAEMVLAFVSSPEYRARFGQP